MKKQFWIAALVLVILIIIAEYDLTKRVHNISVQKRSVAEISEKDKESKASAAASIIPDVKTKEQGRLNFDNQFLRQAAQIGQAQTDPATTELELKTLSKQMQPSDIKRMRQIAEDIKVNGDDRALAVELLARNQTQESLNELAEFVTNQEKNTNVNWSRSQEFETVLRAQAIEGIGIYPERSTADSVLQKMDQRISESFLRDRIARTRAHLVGHTVSPEEQDEQALRKLVE